MTTTIEIAAPPIPGLRFRHFGGADDLPGMLRVYSAAHEADGIEEVTTLEQLRLNYENLVNCDPDRDITMTEVDGELVAHARVFWQELVDGGRSYECFGFVHTDWRRRLAVASMSLDWNFGTGHQDELHEAYGIESDPERIRYYRALRHLES